MGTFVAAKLYFFFAPLLFIGRYLRGNKCQFKARYTQTWATLFVELQSSKMTLPSSSTSVAETMARLSSKSGVTATIAIERTTSTVLQSTGTLGNMFASSASASIVAPGQTAPATSPSTERDGPVLGTSDSGEEQSFKDFAKMVWNYVNATGQLVHDMDAEDDLKLLRLRTRKHELVIVPDAKFIFVVVHDVPSS